MSLNSSTQFEPFRYVMTDMSSIYVGARYTYEELLEVEDTPQKLREVIFRVFMQEVQGDTTIENHLFYLTPDSRSYRAYSKMKARFKMSVWEPAKGRKKAGYVNRVYSLDEIVGNADLFAKKDTTVVEEVHISKLGLSMILV